MVLLNNYYREQDSHSEKDKCLNTGLTKHLQSGSDYSCCVAL